MLPLLSFRFLNPTRTRSPRSIPTPTEPPPPPSDVLPDDGSTSSVIKSVAVRPSASVTVTDTPASPVIPAVGLSVKVQ